MTTDDSIGDETPIGVTILGATGSVGSHTLDVLAQHAQRFRVVGLTARCNTELLFQQCLRHRPEHVVMVEAEAARELRLRLQTHGIATQVWDGEAALVEAAAHPQSAYVMAAIVGAAGLAPTLAAARAGKRVLLANKEALVMSGGLFMEELHRHGGELLPIDSEHNALFQCLPPGTRGLAAAGVRRLLLTASGGPFWELPVAELARVSPAQACAHPVWSMGRKISVDSATMMNKGLEVIEACWLFDAAPTEVQVVIHPQSVVHSLVEYLDGSLLAQMGRPDMRTPIAHALAWPTRLTSGVEPLELWDLAELQFQRPDFERFPCLSLAYQALQIGGTASAILNAANEVAVAAFLNGQLAFTRIASVVEETLAGVPAVPASSLDSVLACDNEARRWATALCGQ